MRFVGKKDNNILVFETKTDADVYYVLYKHDLKHIPHPLEVDIGFRIEVKGTYFKCISEENYKPSIDEHNSLMSLYGAKVPTEWRPSRWAKKYINKFLLSRDDSEEELYYSVTPSWKETDTDGETERRALEKLEESESEEEIESSDLYFSISRVGFYT